MVARLLLRREPRRRRRAHPRHLDQPALRAAPARPRPALAAAEPDRLLDVQPDGRRPGVWAEHRNAIHFTGDSFSTWPMLDFQTRFTAAEGAGIGMPYVSHDIGGFNGNELPNDLYVRWIQAGAVAPILRLHSNHAPRLPWEYGGRAEKLGELFMRLRGSLVPYLYTLARQAYDTGLPLARAMYLEWPKLGDAYRYDRQYMLGDQLLVAPVARPGDPARKRVWFPPGRWVDLFTGEVHTGAAGRDAQGAARADADLRPRRGGSSRAPDYAALRRTRRARSADPQRLRRRRRPLHPLRGRGRGLRLPGEAVRAHAAALDRDRASTLTIGKAQGHYPGDPAKRRYSVRVTRDRAPERGPGRRPRAARLRLRRRRPAADRRHPGAEHQAGHGGELYLRTLMSESQSLKPLAGWSAAFRGRFETRHLGHTWTVDADFLDLDQRLALYRDGDLVERKRSPASFELGPGASIEAAIGVFGMRRIELVAGTATTMLEPVEGTLEAWRLGLARERPGLSTVIGAVSWTVLVIALVTGIGELLGLAGLRDRAAGAPGGAQPGARGRRDRGRDRAGAAVQVEPLARLRLDRDPVVRRVDPPRAAAVLEPGPGPVVRVLAPAVQVPARAATGRPDGVDAALGDLVPPRLLGLGPQIEPAPVAVAQARRPRRRCS